MDADQSYIDELTGVYNRRYLSQKQEQETCKFIAKKTPFSVVMVDIDHFKQINDTHGHVKGDKIIKEFARFLKNTLRTKDVIVRYGGDEFVCFMPHTAKRDAEMTYRRILKNCREQKFDGLMLTLSAGVSSYPDDGQNFSELLTAADQALYDAKRSGRDRIRTPGEKKAVIPIKAFIDRLHEKDNLQRFLLDNVRKMKVAILKGNVGIGKTRLAKEVLNLIRGREIIWCDCIFFSDAVSYYPIREIIKYRMQRLGFDILKEIPLAYKLEIGKLVPEVMSEIRGETGDVDLVLDKYRLFEGIRRILEIGERDKIVIVDNIQWIDTESSEVLKYIMRSMREKPMTFVLIYRVEEKTDTLEEFVAYISREVDISETLLLPFDFLCIKESVKRIIGERPHKDLADYVSKVSGGNPFYIEEIMRELLNGGYLFVEENQWRFKEPVQELVPKALTEIAARKYRTLSQEGKILLEIASVIGWFDIGLLKSITGYNEGHILGLIDSIDKLGFISRQREQFNFSNAVSRQAIYANYVAEAKRLALHFQIAELIERQYEGIEYDVIDMLATHFYHARDKKKGAEYCIKAAKKAEEEYANNNAIRYYSWAIELLGGEVSKDKIGVQVDCIVNRAQLYNYVGDNEKALGDLAEGLKLAIKLSDKKRQAQIKHKKAAIYTLVARYRKALLELEECVKLYKKIDDRSEVAKVLLTEGTIYLRQGKTKNSLRANENALKAIRGVEDQITRANAHNNIGNVYFQQGEYRRALVEYKDSIKIFKKVKDRSGEAKALNNIGNIYYSAGNYVKALSSYQEVLKISREIGYRVNEFFPLRNIGLICYNKGNYLEALHYYEKALKVVRDIQGRDDEAMLLSDMGDIHNNLGDYELALRYYKDSLKVAEEINSRRIACFTLVSLADLHITMNRKTKAKKFLDKAYKHAKGSKEHLQNVLACFCDYYLEEGNFKEFKRTISMVDRLFKREKTRNFEGDIYVLLGRYYSAIRRFDKGAQYFQRALKIFTELKEKLSVGKIYYYWGHLKLERSRKLEARNKLKNALKIFDALDARGWKVQTENAIRKL